MASFPKNLKLGAISLVGGPPYSPPIEKVFKKVRDTMFPTNSENIITKPDPLTENKLNEAYDYSATKIADQLDKKAIKNLTPFCTNIVKPPPPRKGNPYKKLRAKLYKSFTTNANNLNLSENQFANEYESMKLEYVMEVKKLRSLPEPIEVLYVAAFKK